MVRHLFTEGVNYCRQTYPNRNWAYDLCYQAILESSVSIQHFWEKSILVGFGLPIIFFGGTFFYKYIFPKSKKV